MGNEEYQPVLHMEAVRALYGDMDMLNLMHFWEWGLLRKMRDYLEASINQRQPTPDWMIAALNCNDDADIITVAAHTFLMDWRPPEVEK